MSSDELREFMLLLDRRLTIIESKLDERCEIRKVQITEVVKRQDSMQKRIGNMEIQQAYWAGAAAVGGAALAWFLKILGVGR